MISIGVDVHKRLVSLSVTLDTGFRWVWKVSGRPFRASALVGRRQAEDKQGLKALHHRQELTVR